MQQARYVRLYAGDDGNSHFEDIDLALVPVDFAPPAAPLNVAPFFVPVRSMWVGAPAGWAGETPRS